jgi:diguanylate cyclase (GGDEF)-like protein/PAS domain S-box-containing protein
MTLELRIFALPFLLSALVSLALAVIVLQRRRARAGAPLAWLTVEFAVWAAASFMRWSLLDPAAEVFWIKLSHVAFVPAPLTFLLFIARLTRRDRWLSRPVLALLALEPLLTIAAITTNDAHFLFYRLFHPVVAHGFSQMAWDAGPWFWANIAFSYACLLAAVAVLVRALLRADPPARGQLVTVLAGCMLPWAVNVYALVRPAASLEFELTPLAAAASALIFAYALFRQGLLDIVPVARSLLFEKLRDGVLVLDSVGRIVDANEAAQRILHIDRGALGAHIWESLPDWQDRFVNEDLHAPESNFEVQGRRDPSRFYDVSVIALLDGRGRRNGRLVSIRDVTQRKWAELELRRANLQLEQQVQNISALHAELQEQAIRDPLTGLYNRRYLDETLEREFSRARRGSYPISIILMDIDEFKQVNDTYGHKSGDRVLTVTGEIIRQSIRAGDFPCRYGGEEFVVVLPETPVEIAAERAEQVRQRFESLRLFKGEEAVLPTLSLGVASYPAHGRSAVKVLHAADRAMYTAKAAGGNQVMRYNDHRSSMALPPSAEAD